MSTKQELAEDWTALKLNIITGFKPEQMSPWDEIARKKRWEEVLLDRK